MRKTSIKTLAQGCAALCLMSGWGGLAWAGAGPGDGAVERVRAAQAQSLAVPVAGYAVSGSPQCLRPLLGTPGALALGESVFSAPEGGFLLVSPDQRFLLIGGGSGSALNWAPLGPGSVGTPAEVAGSIVADLAAFSPSGQSAVVASSGAKKIRVLSFAGPAPAVSYEFELDASSATVSALAVSDDGETVAAGTSDGTVGLVQLFVRGQAPVQLLQAGNPAVIRYDGQAARWLIVDSVRNEAILAAGGGSEQQAKVFAGLDPDEVGPMSDARISRDGRAIYLIHGSTGQAETVNFDSGAVTRFAVPPAAIESGSLPGGLLVLGTASGAPRVWLVDFGGGEPVARYVPPLPSESALAQEVRQ